MLTDWLAEHQGKETAAIASMLDRQRLLTYQDNPQRTIDHLVRRLGIQLNHAAPPAKNERRFPSQLDEALINPQRLVFDSLRRRDPMKPLGLRFLAERFLANQVAGMPIQLSDLLQRVNQPIVERLDELVIRELQARNRAAQKFGDRTAHQLLTREQLTNVAKRLPQVSLQDGFVRAMLRRLRPGAEVELSDDEQQRLVYLTTVDQYVKQLPVSFNNLKAAAAYRLLEANYARGVFSKELLIRYLKLPRISPIVPREKMNQAGRVDLNQDFTEIAILPRIGNEEPLIRAYLEYFLKDAASSDDFRGIVRDDYLKAVFAETKLIHGVGDEQTWYRMLSPSQRKSVRDRSELRLSAENAVRFSKDEQTVLNVDLKNIGELIIRVYEINTESYYRDRSEVIDTDIDLDGLIATHEQTLSFAQAPVRRHRELIELPMVTGRGVWVVDFVGEGLRARALVRRGSIEHVESSAADGMVFTIINEDRQAIPNAVMTVGERAFVADQDGRIVIPPVVDEVNRVAVISDGKIARRFEFAHLRESYSLEAGIHLDRTQFQSGGKTQIVVRSRLRLGKRLVDPAILRDVSLRMEATDLDGLPITIEKNGLVLDQNAELAVPVRVPTRLASLRVVLSGTVQSISDAQDQQVRTEQEWQLAGVRKTSQTHDAFLTRDGDQYLIEVRGRNGELVPGVAVSISLLSEYSSGEVKVTLQTDQQGRVVLGRLPQITQLRYSVVSGLQHVQDLKFNQVRWPDQIHAIADQPLRLPLLNPAQDLKTQFRLIELRDGSFTVDQSDRMAVQGGFLVISQLPAGDYQLFNRVSGRSHSISMIDGPIFSQVAVGANRHRSIAEQIPLSVGGVERNAEGLRIQLAGDTSGARVHLYASRFIDSAYPGMDLSLPAAQLWGRNVQQSRCGYISDLRLGDEYQYVLRRRYLSKYPGVMLPTPGLLINPWQTEETINRSQIAKADQAPPPSSTKRSGDDLADLMAREASVQAVGASDYDFISDPGVILTNLRPDDQGWVVIPNDVIDGLPIVRLVACNASMTLEYDVPAPMSEVITSDLRLSKSLDSEKAFSLERGVTIVGPERPLDFESLGSAQVQVYGSIPEILKLYLTIIPDQRFKDFSELGSWNLFSTNEKLGVYGRLACHELHLFLWFHDRPFFDEVIRPYLANKKEKQFLDRWLLGDDLAAYARIDRYVGLNIAERALLAQRLPNLQQSIGSQLRQKLESDVFNADLTRRNIDIALNGRAMDAMEGGMLGGAGEAFGMEMQTEKEMLGNQQANRGRGRQSRRAAAVPEADAAMDKRAAPAEANLFFGRKAVDGRGGEAFYRDLDTTKQLAESQWDRVRTVGGNSSRDLVTLNSFWLDVALSDGETIPVSEHVLLPAENRHAALLALAVSGLPMQSGAIELPASGETVYQPEHPVAVVTKSLRQLENKDLEQTVLIGQRFSMKSDVTNNSRSTATQLNLEALLTTVPYLGQVVVSNPTAQRQVVDVFWQIPEGSVPLSGTEISESRTVTLEPFAVESIEYVFYFPESGEFRHYPATVSKEESLLAKASVVKFGVLSELPLANEKDWNSLVVAGNATQIATFLQDVNLQTLEWEKISHRMREADVYRVVIDKLRMANLPIMNLWGYGFFHQDQPAIQTYLSLKSDFSNRVGPVLNSSLLRVDPIEQSLFETLEYSPLVRGRIHQLGVQNEILNPTFRSQYESLTRILGFQNQIDPASRLLLTYYLLLQNRITEAIEQFNLVDRDNVETKLQYDYLAAFLAMHQANYDQATQIAMNYQEYPIPRWRLRFAEMLKNLQQGRSLQESENLDEDALESNPREGSLAIDDRNRRMGDAAEQVPVVVLDIDGNTLRIDHRNCEMATVNFYGVDLELLFSKAPFVREDLKRMAMVRPMLSQEIKFGTANASTEFQLDKAMQSQTLLVEVVTGASRSTSLYFGGGLTTYVSESFGQLQVAERQTQKPIASAYVKVYAKYPNGEVRFYKDGYTDLRGRFDYASLSAADAKGAERYAILVKSEDQGSTIQEVANPLN
ncbi:hypothetical protein OAA19_02315 [Rubripirellula sp.]|nr:hypothetical protein [Rubripirellula sp.]MDB4338923.1 hypothetical protein [Rubripirellula sp.]